MLRATNLTALRQKFARNPTRRIGALSKKSRTKSTLTQKYARHRVLPKVNRSVQSRGLTAQAQMAQKQQAAAGQHVEQVKPELNGKHIAVMDGNDAAVHVAYAMSETAFIYPITPSTTMGEYMDRKASNLEPNAISGSPVIVEVMQSEGGAAGAVHGALAAGGLSSTFTASQGLLLMIPNLYKIAGELMPTVFHVAARTVSKHALSIFNDHSDVMATRQCGWAMLCSNHPQEVMDLALVAHLATIKSRIPFMHFFDGYRTSAGLQKVETIAYSDIARLVDRDALNKNLRGFALDPDAPIMRGGIQRPDIFFQATVSAQPFYEATPGIVKECMAEVSALTGRHYDLFEYVGDPEAERVIVLMGSAAGTVEETIEKMNEQGEKVGLLKVRLFRPWSAKDFIAAVPETAKQIAVLEKTREDGATACPLHLDVAISFSDRGDMRQIVGGQYGLSSKEFTPAMVHSVFNNFTAEETKSRFVVGINDDVNHSSLPIIPVADPVPEGTTQCLVWGFGSDGTVGANKQAIKTIAEQTDQFTQGHFAYDAYKSGGVTISHLRFGPSPIMAEYEVQTADYTACHFTAYMKTLDVVNKARDNSTFVLNSPWTLEQMEKELPGRVKRLIAEKNLQFYNIDATGLALELGLGARINMIMQTAFYKLSNVLPVDEAISLLKQSIHDVYGVKGERVVEKNLQAVAGAMDRIKKIEYPQAWATAPDNEEIDPLRALEPTYVREVMRPSVEMHGDDLPVSVFTPGGYMPAATSKYEKRGVAVKIPTWIPDNCTQCNYCVLVCPHAVIRPFLLDKEETKAAPNGLEARKAKGGSEVAGLNYSLIVSPLDCTGCEVCVEACPDDALRMDMFNDVALDGVPYWDYAVDLPYHRHIKKIDKHSVKGSQFQQPLMEFSGACSGCGETPYLKLATQLFGERMAIANATGCSSVYGGHIAQPYSTNSETGRGPAWGNSLFEDNAEYGYGMRMAAAQRRNDVIKLVEQVATGTNGASAQLKTAMKQLLKVRDVDASLDAADTLTNILENEKDNDPILKQLWEARGLLPSKSQWIVGGDGWAYDIGFGGLDHVMSRGENVNILVLDTEMYSNTGGQISKATPMAAVVKFAEDGNSRNKKDLGLQAMSYGNMYVAAVAMGADYNQCLKAFREAENFPGTSLILALSPCIDWGMEMKDMMHIQKTATESGYWPLYRFDPREETPFQLDSKKIRTDFDEWIQSSLRFRKLITERPEKAEMLMKEMESLAIHKHENMQRMAMNDEELLEYLKKKYGETTSSEKILVLYGSETGNAEYVAGTFVQDLKRRGLKSKALSMDDYDFDDLADEKRVIFVAATCGQGEYPANMKRFMESIKNKDLPSDTFSDLQFSVFGMGDSHYVYYNEAAIELDKRLEELGATRTKQIGLGDDQDEDKYETILEEWAPELYGDMGLPEPEKILLPAQYNIVRDPDEDPLDFTPEGAVQIRLEASDLLTPENYDRDIRHYEFDIQDSAVAFDVGDTLGVHPTNNPEAVREFLDAYGVHASENVGLEYVGEGKNHIPSTMNVGQLFTQVLDIFGKPKRRFYEMLSLLPGTKESDKAELEHLISGAGKDDLRAMTAESLTVADILLKYPSAKPGHGHLIDYVPAIKPRLYSIANSPRMHPGKLQLLVIRDDWSTPSGKNKSGLCSTYLTKVPNSDKVLGRVNPAAVPMPDEHSAPALLAGLGTGLAPLRAFIQDRVFAAKSGEPAGDMTLYFGARHKASEWSYGDEFESYHDDGHLTNIRTAWSRDQEHKIYVQDKVAEDPDLVYDTLVTKNGLFYYCGTGGKAPDMVKDAVIGAIANKGNMSIEEATKYVTEMQINGRYNVESW